MRRRAVMGFVYIVVSTFFFALSGPLAKAMYTIGWTPGAVLLVRVAGSAAVLLVPTLWALRGQWGEVRRRWGTIALYGAASFAGMQGFYFVSIEYLPIALALLIEMTAPVMIVFWIWARTRHRPVAVTFAGIVVSLAGLALLLDLRGATLDLFGVAMALCAALCLAVFFIVSASQTIRIPSIAFTGLGMLVGAIVSVGLNLTELMPAEFGSGSVVLAGVPVPWQVPMLLLVVSTVAAFVFGIVGLRYMGPTVGGFANYAEVPFSVLMAWFFLGELPTRMQLAGGSLILVGIIFIKWGDVRLARRKRAQRQESRSPAS